MEIKHLAPMLGLLVVTAVAAEPAQSEVQKAVQAVYQRSLRADGLMASGQYADAAVAYEGIFDDLSNLVEDDEAASFRISVKAGEPKVTRLLNLGFSELDRNGATEIRADRYCDVIERVMRLNQHVVSSDDYATESQIAGQAIGVVREAKKPVKPSDAPSLAARLKLALAQLQGVVTRAPDVASRTINESTATKALAEGRAVLAKIDQKATATTAAAAVAMPEMAKVSFDLMNEQLDDLQKDIEDDGFVADNDFTMWLEDPTAKLKMIKATLKSAYDQEGRAMPDDVVRPLADRAASLRAAALKKAASLTFPTGLVADPAIEQAVKGQLTKTIKGVKVLKLAMEGREWGINRNDLGLIESRYRYGYVLYQMPDEPYPRCSQFSYREQYAGGGTYTKADGASAYAQTRWQLAR